MHNGNEVEMYSPGKQVKIEMVAHNVAGCFGCGVQDA
jgi:hypothetical protein